MESFIRTFEATIKRRWDKSCLGDFKKAHCTYAELAAEMRTNTLLWEKAGILPGAKIVLNAPSTRNWAAVYMSAVSYGYVAVPVFSGFTPDSVENLCNHSEGSILYTEAKTFQKMNFDNIPGVKAVIDIATMELLASRDGFAELYERRSELLGEYGADDVKLADPSLDDVCCILYTSGSTGNPKGVMLTVGNFSSNSEAFQDAVKAYHEGDNYLSILPYAHIFGLTCDLTIPITTGLDLTILALPPAPTYVKEALMETKPHIFFGVPLVFVKFVEHVLGDTLSDPDTRARLADYENNAKFCDSLRSRVIEATGGNLEIFATGGAAIPEEVEQLLAFQLRLPFVTGYGLTETAPVISVGSVGHYKSKSCGEYLSSLECRIASDDPEVIPGEIQVKGPSVFKGYYKNPDATAAAFTEDGFFRTGDIATMDEEGSLFICGRCKNMLLSENGQNIYPEEIEVVLNSLKFVAESLVLQDGKRLKALIVPNFDAVDKANLDATALEAVMKHNIDKLNSKIPAYAAVATFEILHEPFAKTPKGSIRRFLYK